jgi:hypothetical protein
MGPDMGPVLTGTRVPFSPGEAARWRRGPGASTAPLPAKAAREPRARPKERRSKCIGSKLLLQSVEHARDLRRRPLPSPPGGGSGRRTGIGAAIEMLSDRK